MGWKWFFNMLNSPTRLFFLVMSSNCWSPSLPDSPSGWCSRAPCRLKRRCGCKHQPTANLVRPSRFCHIISSWWRIWSVWTCTKEPWKRPSSSKQPSLGDACGCWMLAVALDCWDWAQAEVLSDLFLRHGVCGVRWRGICCSWVGSLGLTRPNLRFISRCARVHFRRQFLVVIIDRIVFRNIVAPRCCNFSSFFIGYHPHQCVFLKASNLIWYLQISAVFIPAHFSQPKLQALTITDGCGVRVESSRLFLHIYYHLLIFSVSILSFHFFSCAACIPYIHKAETLKQNNDTCIGRGTSWAENGRFLDVFFLGVWVLFILYSLWHFEK